MNASYFGYNSNIFLRCLRILPRSDHLRIPFVVALQVLLALVDLLAVGIIGLIAALSVSGIQSTSPNTRILNILEVMGIQGLELQKQVALLGIIAASLLVTRTVASVYITRKTLIFLSNRGAQIASDTFARLLAQPLSRVQRVTSQEVIQAITNGTTAITLGITGAFLITFADGIVTFVMLVGLFFLNPVMASAMFIFFGTTALLLYKLMSSQAHSLGYLQMNQNIAVNETIMESLSSYRELLVKDRRDFYVRKVELNRFDAAVVLARVQFLPNVSKYIIEIMIVFGAVAISAYQFLARDATSAIAVLSVFLASATRIAPAIMRIQQGAVSIKAAAGVADRALDLIDNLNKIEKLPSVTDIPNYSHEDFSPSIVLDNVNYTYPGNNKPTLSNVNLRVNPGDFVAIVGPSGAGKTTLIDLILGVAEPDSGVIQISNFSPLAAISKWPGAISYVPQDILIINGSIAENVAFGFPIENVELDRIKNVLKFAELQSFVNDLTSKEDAQVGERGTKISGGQRQRLGIARAMLTNPKLIVLDEATSTLDAQTEQAISTSFNKLKGTTTIVMIAHRLSTVTNANLIIYLDKGAIKAAGTLAEVRAAVPDFDIQAKLMGI